MSNIPFQSIGWLSIDKIEYPGRSGIAFWQTIRFEGLRIQLVEYSNGYLAHHWSQKGHIVHSLEGEFKQERKLN